MYMIQPPVGGRDHRSHDRQYQSTHSIKYIQLEVFLNEVYQIVLYLVSQIKGREYIKNIMENKWKSIFVAAPGFE